MKRSGTHRLYGFGVLVVLALNGIFALQFMMDPLGLAPVLDARENLAWAERIAAGEVPAEPMYRALGYPALLAAFAKLGMLSGATAMALGMLCHGLNAFLVGCIARRLWANSRAAWLAGLLYGAYPVAIWFAVQALDITLGTSFFLGALAVCLRDKGDRVAGGACLWLIGAGMLGGLAVATRPNFLPAVLCLPLFAALSRGRILEFRTMVAVGGGLALIVVAQGWVNHALSGEFRVLPWQGTYNLYAANHETANGKFYKQRVSFDAVPEGMNSTRMESEYLYREAVGADAPMEVDAMGRYWRTKLMESIFEDPLRWVGLMGRKVVYLFNDWEQYNNLTYAYHKERFPLLKWNPLGWGLLLLGAAAALVLGWGRLSKAQAAAVGLCVLAYAAGVLLFCVSARFRLPLAPLLCVFCGGLAGLSWEFVRRHRSRCLVAAGLLVGLAVLSYGDWFDARNRETFIQDEILLANAALQSGDDATALEFASKALARDGSRQDARRLQVSALFNLWLVAEGQATEKLWQALGTHLGELRGGDAATRFIEGVFYWREGERDAATASWETAVERNAEQAGSSAAALEWVNASPGKNISPQARQIGGLLKRDRSSP